LLGSIGLSDAFTGIYQTYILNGKYRKLMRNNCGVTKCYA
jgi:hypothetical protein